MEDYKQILELLKRLQDLQLEAIRLRDAIARTPGEIEALEREAEEGVEAVERAQEALRAEEKANHQLEQELGAMQDKLDHSNEQMLKVKTNEQLWALQKEVTFAKDKISDIETRIIESMERLDAARGTLEEAERERERLSEENRKEISERERRLVEMESELEEVTRAQQVLHQDIPEQHQKIFYRVQAAKGGIAVAEARDGVCQACNVRIRPQIFMEIRHFEGIYQCDNCGRILIYDEEPPLENPSQIA